jgi:hypothetical protein
MAYRRGRYWYRSRRSGPRVTTEYLGAGPLGQFVAMMDAAELARRQEAREALQQEHQVQTVIDRALDMAGAKLRGLVREVLHGAGYHQHHRQWRKRRTMATENGKEMTPAELERLLDATSGAKPKGSDLAALRQGFAGSPTLWRRMSMAQASALTVMRQVTDSEKGEVILWANYDGMVHDLGGESAPPLERALIEHVALCWLRLQDVEQRCSHAAGEPHSIAELDFLERRLSATQRRYLRACETLARVRRLRLPAVQVNIGERQVNMAR